MKMPYSLSLFGLLAACSVTGSFGISSEEAFRYGKAVAFVQTSSEVIKGIELECGNGIHKIWLKNNGVILEKSKLVNEKLLNAIRIEGGDSAVQEMERRQSESLRNSTLQYTAYLVNASKDKKAELCEYYKKLASSGDMDIKVRDKKIYDHLLSIHQ